MRCLLTLKASPGLTAVALYVLQVAKNCQALESIRTVSVFAPLQVPAIICETLAKILPIEFLKVFR